MWFAGNVALVDLVSALGLANEQVGDLASSVQFGFIFGTLLFALFNIADRISPSKLFFVCAILGAGFNSFSIWDQHTWMTLLFSRFMVGFFLAGIYPVGMKISADHFGAGLGKSLGFLVGALVLGTAAPHLIGGVLQAYPWQWLLLCTSFLSILGGILMFIFVPDGPFRKAAQKLNLSSMFLVFKEPKFRGAALGYFGHMWELYAFWTFTPLLLIHYNELNPSSHISIPIWSFIIIGIGGLACVIGGHLSQRFGASRIAFYSLLASLACILIAPFVLAHSSTSVVLILLIIWGMVVIADSPMFSTLVANHAEPSVKGSALTIVNCFGFSITIISIQTVQYIAQYIGIYHALWILAIGPIFGLLFFWQSHMRKDVN